MRHAHASCVFVLDTYSCREQFAPSTRFVITWDYQVQSAGQKCAWATPINIYPQTNSKYQFVNALYSSLTIFETTNDVLQIT